MGKPVRPSGVGANGAGYAGDRNSGLGHADARVLLGGFLTFVAILAYCVVWIWQGLDITDEGFSLTNHLLIANGGGRYVYGMVWLSDWVGGAWLRLIGDPGLIGARLGWALMMAATGLVAYWVLTAYFSWLASALSVIATAVAVNYGSGMIINYNYVPALILVAACGMILASQHGGAATPRRFISAIAAGVLLGLGVMGKFALLLAVVLPLVPIVVGWWCLRRYDARALLVAGTSLLSTAVTIVLCVLWLAANGRLDEYVSIFAMPLDVNEHASLRSLLLHYARDAIEMAEHVIALAALFFTLAIAVRAGTPRYQIKRLAPLLFFVLLNALALSATLLVLGVNHAVKMFSLALPGMSFGLGAFCLLAACYCAPREGRSVPLLTLLALGLCLPLALTAGSRNGLLQMRIGLWLILPAGLLLFTSSVAEVSAKVRGKPVDRDLVRPYLVGAAMVFVLFAVGARCVGSYRDLGNRFRLTAELQHPRLRYVHTSNERAASVDELLREVEQRVRPGNDVLAYNCVPMVHYATRTGPALGWPWPTILHKDVLEARLNELAASRPPPSLVVRAKTNPRERAWAFAKVDAPRGLAAEKLDLIDRAVDAMGYEEVWSNNDFLLMALPEPSAEVAGR